MRMAAVGPGCEGHSCFLHTDVPRYLQHVHQDLAPGMHLDSCPRGRTGFWSLCQKGLEMEEEMGEEIIMPRIYNYSLALHVLHHTGF